MTTLRTSGAVALLLAATSCTAVHDLFSAPKPEDPLDGYKGSLAEAGVNTEMDWGPGQKTLLADFKALHEEHAKLKKRFEQIQGESQTARAQLAGESETLDKEKKLRIQAEAEAEMLRTKRRELEARILSLSIEKAQLEQNALKARILELTRSMEEAPAPAEAAAPVRR
jgi:hypothetical protein